MVESYPTALEDIVHAEALLLGNIFLHPERWATVGARLQPEDFCEERHRLIYEALLAVSDTSELDFVHAISILLTQDELECMGGISYLTTLKQLAESSAVPIEDQVHLLKQAILNRLLEQIGEALCTLQGDSHDLKRVIGDLERANHIIRQLFSASNKPLSPLLHFQADLDEYLSDLEYRRRQHIALSGIPTGFSDLDTITGGLQRSDLIIIASPPSIGKTSFALSIALHVLLKAHRSVGLFSLEVPKKRVIERLLAMEAHLDQRLLRSPTMEDDEWERLGKASATLSGARLWIDDTVNLSTVQLHDKARLLAERCGIELLIVDYVHLMFSGIHDSRHENRVQEIGEISRSLKVLARELDIPVLALAQVSRAFEGRPSKKLQLSDLRDGSLENDADLVLFLSVAEADTTGATASRLATISIAKHRNGPRADLDICFEPGSPRFHDLQALLQAPVPQLQPFTPKQTAPQYERLQDIMARMPKRQTAQEKPKLFETKRELPQGYVFEDEELDDNSEPGVTIVPQ
jgi:replicative DNA helicase